ncbi:hypothetical protein GPL32_02995 [Halomonas alkaliphila]|uniref:Uncharacterized protein n=2 Tax=Vreelandella TaxID=3137766 RepID=A0A7C9P5T5_9GAMM|nr:hypothetical protein [Halomonas zhaodongensis]NDL69474.1 hypothetical protein [Halomonas alkaliphila]NYS43818.1 hypothetical protein [Halomonas zhaodongensis]
MHGRQLVGINTVIANQVGKTLRKRPQVDALLDVDAYGWLVLLHATSHCIPLN